MSTWSLNSKPFFSETEAKQIVDAITEAERLTSGEIRVHVEASCGSKDVLDRAVEVFYKLEMQKTSLCTGVLIYIAYEDHKLAILGDKGINSAVPVTFWDTIKEKMIELFAQNRYVDGVVFAVTETGLHLKQFFPITKDDKNELSNEISQL